MPRRRHLLQNYPAPPAKRTPVAASFHSGPAHREPPLLPLIGDEVAPQHHAHLPTAGWPIDDNSFFRPPPAFHSQAGVGIFNPDFTWTPISGTKGQAPLDPVTLDYFIDPSNALPCQLPDTIDASGRASPPSSVSQVSSTGSFFSPSNTEKGFDGQTLDSTISRGGSPFRQAALAKVDDPVARSGEEGGHVEGEFVCLGPECESTFVSEDDLRAHVASAHALSCSWDRCRHPGFASRDAMIWHVKIEHLLICPTPGCAETSFQLRNILESHIRVAHPEDWKMHNPDRTVEPVVKAPPMLLTTSSQGVESATPKARRHRDIEEQRKLREYAVTLSKKRCREQLRGVVEKRAKRVIGTPKSIESPTEFRSRTPRPVETASFPLVWEHGVLPFLIEHIPKWCGPGHVISVSRGRTPSSRRICIMTRKPLSRARRIIIAAHVQDLLPESYRQTSTFIFSAGEVRRIDSTPDWPRGTSGDDPDAICEPRNPYFHRSLCMGDSVGIAGDSEGRFEPSTATLGPCVVLGGASYWLANFHPFADASRVLESVSVEHPSPCDRSCCLEEQHDAMTEEDDFRLGTVTAASGLDLKTTRITHDPYWDECDKEAPLVVTDWSIIPAKNHQANILRTFPSETHPLLQLTPVKSTSIVVPGAMIISSGRTSGHQRGQICEIPAYVSGDSKGNATGLATREWFIEEPWPFDDEASWIRGGIGVGGDSGAAIVDAETHALIGQLWGRNRYFGTGPRHTFFTPIRDVFDDVQERCGQQGRPQLPQFRDEADRYPAYPACKQCYDRRTYLDSRRGSRESLRSMIGGVGASDHDLTSIEAQSELATPKDQQYWLRHAGIEDVGLSFGSGASPVGGVYPPYGAAVPGTPGAAEMKSPYAMTLQSDDLYDTDYAAPNESGKRAAIPYPMARSTHNEGMTFKRQRQR